MVDTRKSKGVTPQKERLKERNRKRALASSMDKERVAKIKKSNVAVTSSPVKGSSNKGGCHEAGKSSSPSINNDSTGAIDNDEYSNAMNTTTPSVDNAWK